MNWTSVSMLQVFLASQTIEQNTCSYFYHTSPEMSLHRRQDILPLIALDIGVNVTCCSSAQEVQSSPFHLPASPKAPPPLKIQIQDSSAWCFLIPHQATVAVVDMWVVGMSTGWLGRWTGTCAPYQPASPMPPYVLYLESSGGVWER